MCHRAQNAPKARRDGRAGPDRAAVGPPPEVSTP